MNKKELTERIIEYPFHKEFVYSQESKCWYTYGQLWENAIRFMKFFQAKEIEEVSVVLENGIELFICYFACMLGNIKIVPIDPMKSEIEINCILDNHPNIFRVSSENELPEITLKSADEESVKALLEGVDYEKPYMVTYTSGSTGVAKGVIHSLSNLIEAGIVFGEAVGYDAECIVCHTMPMTYMAGILNTIIMPFIMGSKIVLFKRFSVMTAISFWKNVKEHSVNTFWLSPTMLNILLTVDRKGDIAEYFKGRKTIFCVGTAPLFPQLKQNFEERYGVSLLQSYGLSETLFISTRIPGVSAEDDSVGTILNKVDLQFSDSEEIMIDVPWMYLGYSNENTADYFEGQYYLSGDLGKVDNNNNLYITGRKKDLIIRGGMNISPKQIEETILSHERIKECAVTSVVQNNEEYILCFYVANGDVENTAVTLNKLVIDRLGKAYKVDKFIEKKEIPKNLNGKLDKETLKKEYLNDSKI